MSQKRYLRCVAAANAAPYEFFFPQSTAHARSIGERCSDEANDLSGETEGLLCHYMLSRRSSGVRPVIEFGMQQLGGMQCACGIHNSKNRTPMRPPICLYPFETIT